MDLSDEKTLDTFKIALLLDVNILIALFESVHLRHEEAHDWLDTKRLNGWATCPITQNRCIRIISQPTYSVRLPVWDISQRLWNAVNVVHRLEILKAISAD